MKTTIPFVPKTNVSKIKRALRNLCLIPAWFLPMKGLRVFFHRLRGVKIGRNVEIGYFVILDNRRPDLITIEDNVYLTAMSIVLTHDLSKRNSQNVEIIGEVLIKKGAFIGMNSIILPGVTIGENSVIGAGTVVAKDTEEGSVYIGTAAKRFK